MRFALFTRTLPANVRVYINPAHVVAVDTFANYTRIHTLAAAQDSIGPMHTIGVVEGIDQVISALQHAATG
ncbi:hypothetical protein [Kumtagia ephedrae]|uniref:Uncharacterized protein n=1 Tax=Kumtagia ephedrae TaxID=2116701 RepID=A0A2P7RMI4_9HYPH|nr:hypothetical protein [Mesorhizobium ephedrae]PSJ51420.1 hypothetical protein C7I84_27510 [Mesorhizobium ephedrae]